MSVHQKLTIPHACNAHLHIIDPAFPNDGKAARPDRHGGDLCQAGRRAGTGAGGVRPGQALCHGQRLPAGRPSRSLAPSCARGIAVVTDQIGDKELEQLHQGGVRGLRFSVWNPNNAVVSFDMCEPLSHRVSDLGWNMQLHMSARQLMEQEEIVSRLPGKVVIDHMGRLDPEKGIDDPAYACLCRLIDRGNVWVKLCGPYLNTKTGYPWADAAKTARPWPPMRRSGCCGAPISPRHRKSKA